MLLNLLKRYERDPFDRSVDNRVVRLRRRIEPDPAHPVSSARCVARATCSIRAETRLSKHACAVRGASPSRTRCG